MRSMEINPFRNRDTILTNTYTEHKLLEQSEDGAWFANSEIQTEAADSHSLLSNHD